MWDLVDGWRGSVRDLVEGRRSMRDFWMGGGEVKYDGFGGWVEGKCEGFDG